MHFQFIVAPPTPALTPPTVPATETSAELLQQLLEVQREHLSLMKTRSTPESDAAASRWQTYFTRWQSEFPNLSASLREVLPSVERAFLRLMEEMVHFLKDDQMGNLENDFSFNEFLDRFAMRASQVGTILNLLGQMTGACRDE